MGQDFNLWGFSLSGTKVILVLGHCRKPKEHQRGFLLFFFFRHIGDIEKETFSHLQGPRKRMGKGRGKSGPYGRNCCSPCFERKITILIKEGALEKIT